MKKLLAALIVMSSLTTLTYAQTKRGNFGLGVILGDPTGLSGKYFMGTDAIDGAISYHHDELVIYGDYLRHFPGKFKNQNAFVSSLNPYVGIGPVLAFDDNNHDHHHNHLIEDDDDDFGLGLRIPLGVEWIAPELPLGVALELAPGLMVIPGTDAFIQGGLAVRYYF